MRASPLILSLSKYRPQSTQGGTTMTTLSQLRRRVDALKRKYARELAVVRLRRQAEEFSHRWARDVADRKPAPQSQTLHPANRRERLPAQDLYVPRHLPGTLPRPGRYPRLPGRYFQPASPDPLRAPAGHAPVGGSCLAANALPHLGVDLYPLAEPEPPIAIIRRLTPGQSPLSFGEIRRPCSGKPLA